MIQNKKYNQKGFTLIELLVVIAIIGLLATIIIINFNSARDKAKAAQSLAITRSIKDAAILYREDMGFYPPDVNRGCDPGFGQKTPTNPDDQPCGTDCRDPDCPADWQDAVNEKWKGPYMQWPQSTAWSGEFQYNYWPSGGVRANAYGGSDCTVPPGIYIGIGGNYSDTNGLIPKSIEQTMIDKNQDNDQCGVVNGEAQVLLFPL